MPRFHFDIREDSRLIPDEDGQNFASVDVARKEAMLTGASIAREAFVAGSADHVVVDVREDEHAPCLKISITLEVEELADG
ncbi:DUF6894 family protein [Bradyrhizobium sp. GCM10027634]|uniref:DUF6894 family protein n=1 Tax=unclassified Bradyrhizobium TaxID=2631580 RepID=UPI00188D39EF|nr:MULTISPECIES: hypothetical protein [unclassified Bradyrhizobium]MDN5001511.1 hypothetical protein [Bradyrhizobium sp. WYCCWR 12677]QOZ46146.1 hypothetical protein XH89_23705 [Bradyrhizobium sp. CCBAU 53340]